MNLFPDMPQPFDRFDLWWAAYPRRVCKGDARKAFAKLKVNDAMLDAMLAALEWQKKQDQWLQDGGKYIPYPATYLNREQWSDEPLSRPVARDVDWFEECKVIHGGACGLDRFTHARLVASKSIAS